MLNHPGHTKGSCSFIFNTKDGNATYRVLIANLPSVITNRKFSDIKDYPTIQEDYKQTFAAMQKINFDIWVASHANQFNLHQKRKPGAAYNPKVFMDKQEYVNNITALKNTFLEKVKE